jgi:hypothetical protein
MTSSEDIKKVKRRVRKAALAEPPPLPSTPPPPLRPKHPPPALLQEAPSVPVSPPPPDVGGKPAPLAVAPLGKSLVMKARLRGQRRASVGVAALGARGGGSVAMSVSARVVDAAVVAGSAVVVAGGGVRARALSEPTRPSWQMCKAASVLKASRVLLRHGGDDAASSTAAQQQQKQQQQQQKQQQGADKLVLLKSLSSAIGGSLQQHQQRLTNNDEREARAAATLAGVSAELDAIYARHDLRLAKPGFRNDESFVYFDDAIQNASAERLMDLVGRSLVDDTLRDTLIFAHPLFTDAHTLLQRVLATFWLPEAQHVVDKYNARRGMTQADCRRHAQLGVMRFLCSWLDEWVSVFGDDGSPAAELLTQFVSQLRAGESAECAAWADLLASTWARARTNESRMQNRASIMLTKPQASNARRHFALLDVPSADLAQQWALLNSALLAQIELRQLCTGKWTAAGFAPTIDRLSTWIDERTFWVASEIVSEGNQSKRAATLAYFLSVAETAVELNDFMTLRAIYLALQLNEVARLKHTWAALPDESVMVWRTVSALMSYDKNSQVYRLFLHERDPPFVPCPTVFLKDLLKHFEQAPDPAAPHLLSMLRLYRWAADVARLRAAQSTTYEFPVDLDVVDWLLHRVHVLSRAELRAAGLRAESAAAEAPSTIARPVATTNKSLRKLSSSHSAAAAATATTTTTTHAATAATTVAATNTTASSTSLAGSIVPPAAGAKKISAARRSSSPELAVPAKCERCGKRAPDRRVDVDVNVKMCVCGKCFNELRKVTGPSLYSEPLPAVDKLRTRSLFSLRRRSSKSKADDASLSSSDSDDDSSSAGKTRSFTSRIMPKSRRQQAVDEFASKVQAFAALADTSSAKGDDE